MKDWIGLGIAFIGGVVIPLLLLLAGLSAILYGLYAGIMHVIG